MKQLSLEDLFTILQLASEAANETEPDIDDEDDTDESSPTNLSAPVAAAHIIEGALNYLIEQNAFPTPEQMHVLTELRTLELSYEG